MEYHEIGEIFRRDGVMLEVVKSTNNSDCKSCYFNRANYHCSQNCICTTRKDHKSVIFKLVKQCNPKDMEQKTEINVEGTDETFAIQVTNNQSDEEIFGLLLEKLFTTYKAKDADYGSSFAEMFDELGIDYAYGKLREKINRIKVLRKQPNMVENEGLEDALLDTAGYAILTLVELKKRKSNEDTK